MNEDDSAKPITFFGSRSSRQGKCPLTIVYESGSRRASLDESIIREAMLGPVWVLDAGNCFNPLRLVRAIRWQTLQIQQVLEQIQVARAFTCFQVVALLQQTRNLQGPVFILRPLTVFRDEMIPVHERLRLLKEVDVHIDRLQNTSAVTVMIKGGCFQGDPLLDWLSALQARADDILFPNLVMPPRPLTFWES